MAPTPIVSTEQVAGVTDAYLDRMADLARRLDVPAAAVAEVTRRAGVAMVDSCAAEPETVGDILGRWAANIRALATRVRTGTTTAMPATSPATRPVGNETADPAVVSGGGEARATSAVIEGLDERRRLALLLRDSYDAPPGALAVALGVSPAEADTVVAEARLRLMEGINGRPAPTLAGHEVIAGISLGTLGALADGSALDADPAVRLRRRHVGGCQACAAILDVQNRARVVMAGLPVLALADAARQPTLDAIVTRADAGLLTADEVEAAVARDAKLLPTAVVAVALTLALIIGVGVGAILRHAKTTADETPSPTSSGVILLSPGATATATATASKKASPSATVSPTPTFTRTFAPTTAPSSLKPTTKPKPKKSATVKPTKAVTTAPTTSSPVVSTEPTVATPTSAAPSVAPPSSAAPTSAAPTSAAPTSSAPVIIPTH